jgi:hypothetical protein
MSQLGTWTVMAHREACNWKPAEKERRRAAIFTDRRELGAAQGQQALV